MSLKDMGSRRADDFGEHHATATVKTDAVSSTFLASATIENDNPSTQAAQREPYGEAEADRREREARYRISRQREQRQAARYFHQLQRGCVRRA